VHDGIEIVRTPVETGVVGELVGVSVGSGFAVELTGPSAAYTWVVLAAAGIASVCSASIVNWEMERIVIGIFLDGIIGVVDQVLAEELCVKVAIISLDFMHETKSVPLLNFSIVS
jgi:hypothetical protein